MKFVQINAYYYYYCNAIFIIGRNEKGLCVCEGEKKSGRFTHPHTYTPGPTELCKTFANYAEFMQVRSVTSFHAKETLFR